MIKVLKRWLYFPIAYYFAFWAGIQLRIWKPRIILVTGSSGKTTLLHLIESQLQTKARYSHHANSSYGIPFDILGLKREKLTPDEWPYLILMAPFRAFKKPFREKLYIVEADSDRPYEGKFLGRFLKPEVTIWLNTSRTHSMNFDRTVRNGKFKTVDAAIAYEFGNYLENAASLVIINSDSELIRKQLERTSVKKILITNKDLKGYEVLSNGTKFQTNKKIYSFNVLLPKNTFYSIEATDALMGYLRLKLDSAFSNFYLPPGRSSIFKGIKNTTIIDSTYNATLDGIQTIIEMFDLYPAQTKWAVLSDMVELGEEEKEEHEKLAQIIAEAKSLSRVILMGPRTLKYTYPLVRERLGEKVLLEKFLTPKEVLNYLLENIQSGETILFKGARFLEGVIEHLLADKNDVRKLCRREKIWEIRRKEWGL